jgi:hypothetical protein
MSNRPDDDIEIIPPSRAVQTRPSANRGLAEVRHSTPPRANPGGILSSMPMRWEANAQAKTYAAFARRTSAERALVEADTELGESLIKNVRMRHRFAELPEILATDRTKRQVQRNEELRELRHQVEMAETRRMQELAIADTSLTDARTGLMQARERLTVAQTGLLDAEQALMAQRDHGGRYHELGWKQKNGERELYIEEQEAVLSEHRKRAGRSTQDELQHASDSELLQRRAEMNADGHDTRAVDDVLARRSVATRR